MNVDKIIEYHGCEIRAVVIAIGKGRYAAVAIITDRDDETRTLGVDGEFANPQEARDEALELAVAWIQQRSVVSDHVQRTWLPVSNCRPDAR
ncbi:hypothetical protein [Paraburkholderia bannensis]|uniref:hypothetical protein n=1 Tax=Paraburkholderia bannensis TaxID=765414 RepID=UPI0004862A3E|nr:hypothetical protein [Paraburkholderia bannensis]